VFVRLFVFGCMYEVSQYEHGLKSIPVWIKAILCTRNFLLLVTPSCHEIPQNICIQPVKSSTDSYYAVVVGVKFHAFFVIRGNFGLFPFSRHTFLVQS